MTALERLPEQRMETRVIKIMWREIARYEICIACQEHGACRDWVLYTAELAQCDPEWLAERVLAGEVDADTSVVEIRKLWKERENV